MLVKSPRRSRLYKLSVFLHLEVHAGRVSGFYTGIIIQYMHVIVMCLRGAECKHIGPCNGLQDSSIHANSKLHSQSLAPCIFVP